MFHLFCHLKKKKYKATEPQNSLEVPLTDLDAQKEITIGPHIGFTSRMRLTYLSPCPMKG